MARAQLAILPTDSRRAPRRVVNLAARLREPGARLVDIELLNLSTTGFMAQCDASLEQGDPVWLKLPGCAPESAKVVWIEDGKAGFEFATPLHEATVEMLAAAGRKTPPRRHFGFLPRR
jgi:hypothetical protein